jgi:small-conductance mechanosensitive channel
MAITLDSLAADTASTLLAYLAEALPRVISGLVFLTIAYVAIRLLRRYLRRVLRRVYPADQRLIADFSVLVVTLFLWFGAGLALLKVVGLGDIAASLGTATGFVALGVSYALSNMIADAVAGVYLLRDPDFNPGDKVTTESTTGVVRDIGLRKSRIEIDSGDVVVLANREVEKKWTLQSGSPATG